MKKPTINVVVIGHAGAGKSTTADHLCFKHVDFDGQKIGDLENESDKVQISSKYAWDFDRLVGQRNPMISTGISIRSFESPKFKFNIIDTPGQSHSMKDTIIGMSQADIGLLVIDSSVVGNESDIDSYGKSKEHCLLAYTLGVKQMVVVINKMDDKTVNFSEDRWKIIRSDVAAYLKKVGYKPMKIPFIPISGLRGDNLGSKSIFMPWYAGPVLSEALDNVTCPKRPTTKPLRVPIQEVIDVEGIGAVLVGRVESGVLKPGISIHAAPSGTLGIVESLQVDLQTATQAMPGEIVRIILEDRKNGLPNIHPGHVLSNHNDCPAQKVSSFEAQIIIMNYPGKIVNGYIPIIHCHTSHMPCTFTKIKEKLDPRTGKILLENPESVQAGDVCIVEIKPKSPLCIEQFRDFPALGRLAVRDFGQTIGVGVVKTTIYEEEDDKC